jgi:hypothetical protein
MAEYKGIKGFKVQYLSADPSNPIIGQTWYNSTSKDLKYTSATTAGAWATGGNLNTARDSISRSRNSNCRISFWWRTWFRCYTATEEYDGATWTTVLGSMGTARAILAGCGIQTAALAFGGDEPPPQHRSNRRIRWFYLDI